MLSAADSRILDLLVDAGFDLGALPPLSADDRLRAERLVGLVRLIDVYPDGSSDEGVDAETLIAATLARVQQAEGERADRMRLDPAREADIRSGGRKGFRMGDLVAVASIAILATTVLVPLFNWRSAQAIDTQCANNLRMIAQGLEVYTASNDAMPMVAGLGPDLATWLGYSNADNLNVLAAQKYCPPGCMSCPGDTEANACYAYQAPTAERRPAWSLGPRVVVVGDRNPLIDLKRNGETIASVALNAASHSGRGQNLLFSDASVEFDDSPYLSDAGTLSIDNIWLPFGDQADALTVPPGARRVMDAFLLH